MKLRIFGLLSLALCVCLASSAQAQRDQEGGRQRGGRGGQRGGGGFGGRGGLQMGGAMELINLLRIEEVRKEVEIDDDTYEAISADQVDMRSLFRASEEERAEKMKEANEKATAMLDEALLPKQQKRLMGLLIQQNGLTAAANELIAKEIELDKDGIKKVQEAATESRSGMREKMREMFQGGQDGERPDMTKIIADMRKDTDTAVGKVLTSDQKEKLEALKGEKFDFPERQRGGRGGARGGRGGRGGPGGQRGGDDN